MGLQRILSPFGELIMPEEKYLCKTCKFYVPLPDWDGVGTCHRNSPSPYVAGLVNPDSPYDTESAAAWPIVKGTDWSGEWIAAGVDLEDVETKREEGIEV